MAGSTGGLKCQDILPEVEGDFSAVVSIL